MIYFAICVANFFVGSNTIVERQRSRLQKLRDTLYAGAAFPIGTVRRALVRGEDTWEWWFVALVRRYFVLGLVSFRSQIDLPRRIRPTGFANSKSRHGSCCHRFASISAWRCLFFLAYSAGTGHLAGECISLPPLSIATRRSYVYFGHQLGLLGLVRI